MTHPGIGTWLTRRAQLTTSQEAIVDGDRRVTYGELDDRVNRLSAGLTAQGLRSGDRVAVLAQNRLEVVEILFSAAKLGLIVVPLNWRLTARELAFMVEDSGAKTLIYGTEVGGLAEALLEIAPLSTKIVIGKSESSDALPYDQLIADHPGSEPRPDISPTLETPHIIMYTAGTTGKPKGAVLAQRSHFWNALNLGVSMDFTSADRNLVVLPMFHIGGIGLFTLPMLYYGGTVVIQRTFDADTTFKLLRDERISLFFGVPAIFLLLAQHPDFSQELFSKVRVVMSGGAPLPVSLVEQYHEASISLRQGFGMSEAGPSISTLSEELALDKAGSIGRPLFHLDAMVVDESMRELPSGEVGELVIRGPNVMVEYWNRPAATTTAFSNGWFRTGDLARQDFDGDLFIVDRKKDMFISGGENVYPAEVENVIFELPQIAEAAVVGVHDERWGEVGRAVVALKENQSISAEALIDHLKDKLAKYKIPKQVTFVDALPRNAAGKVLKNALRG